MYIHVCTLNGICLSIAWLLALCNDYLTLLFMEGMQFHVGFFLPLLAPVLNKSLLYQHEMLKDLCPNTVWE